MNLEEFNTNFAKHGGARSYLFKCVLGFPSDVYTPPNMLYMAKATSIPEASLGEIPIYWQGMNNKLPGPRTYGDWSVTLILQNDWGIRYAFEEWLQKINNWSGGGSYDGSIGYRNQTQTLTLLDERINIDIKVITLVNSWPKSIGAVTLDYGTQEVASFDVTFAYQYFEFKDV